MKMNSLKYVECESWQGFVDRIMQEVGRGYYYYSFVKLSELAEIEKASFLCFSYSGISVILSAYGERFGFKDIRTYPMNVCISETLELMINFRAGDSDLRMSENCYEVLKNQFLELLSKGETEHLKYFFYNLNLIPAYQGIVEQKESLLVSILESAKKYCIPLKRSDFVTRSTLLEAFV